jgi:NhaA family Na+:H+ antiporter
LRRTTDDRSGPLRGLIERFLRIEAASGIVLLAAAAIALAWANSTWGASYESVWSTPLSVGASVKEPVRFWINDVLMTLFFLVVGLELRREIQEGVLSDVKQAVLPIATAAGGMLVPALVYLAINHGPIVDRGWAIPTATDIAFSVGALSLLGRRVPPALRVLLLALATADDIGSVLVLAFVRPSGVHPQGLAIVAGGLVGVLALWRLGLRRVWPYAVPGVVLWWGALRAGFPPALTGVVLGFVIPATRTEVLHRAAAYIVTPLFALANAGVNVRDFLFGHGGSTRVAAGVAAARVLGKPAGILLAAAIVTGIGVSRLPREVTWRGVLVIGCIAGIGFTVPIYVAGIAFSDQHLVTAAKFGLIFGSVASALIGVCSGWLLLRRPK